MKIKDWLYARVFPRLLWVLVHVIHNTLKITSVNEEPIRGWTGLNRRLVYVFWHGRSFFLIKYMSRRNITIIASPSRDGRLLADILRMFHYGVIPGSSDKSPIRAVIQSVQTMRGGGDMAIAVDGPTGPRCRMKPGALFMAKKMNAPVVVGTNSCSPAWTFKSWDRFILPRPFGRGVMVFSDLIWLSPDTDDETVRKETAMIEAELNRLTKAADEITGYKD
jgi:lysophospholipid acyltransferase (LPLAT)-like uncharacterized protein